MTTEERYIHDAAKAYAANPTDDALGHLVTAVMNLPLSQWPANACGVETVGGIMPRVTGYITDEVGTT